MFREIGFNKPGFDRNIYVSVEDVPAEIEKLGGIETFESLAMFTKPTEESPYTMDLAFDIDCKEDLQQALEDTKKLFQYFWDNEIIMTPYFSGGKGFHLVLPAECIGLEPREDTAELYRGIAEELIKKLKMETIDTAIYNKRRIFRSVGSINYKRKLYKIRLTIEQLMDGTLEEILELAKTRVVDREMEYTELVPRLKKQVLAHVGGKKKPAKKTKKKAHEIPIKDVLDRLGVEHRHNVVYENGEETSMRIHESGNYINRFSEKPPRGDTYEMVMYFKGCSFKEAKDWLETEFDILEDAEAPSLQDIKEQTRRYYETETLDWHIDKNPLLRLPLLKKTQFGLVVGTYNSGKTEFVYSVALNNAREGRKVVYLSLEMSAWALADRRARAARGYTTEDVNVSSDKLNEVLKGMDKHQHKNLLVIEKPTDSVGEGVSRAWVQKIVQQHKPDLLIVDNFNMIGGNASMSEKYSEQTRLAQFLKDFAEESNCCIIGVHHIGKAVQKESKPPESLTMADAEGSGQLANIALWALVVGRYKNLTADSSPQDRAKFCIKVDRDRVDGFQGYGHWYFYKGDFLMPEEYKIRNGPWNNF